MSFDNSRTPIFRLEEIDSCGRMCIALSEYVEQAAA